MPHATPQRPPTTLKGPDDRKGPNARKDPDARKGPGARKGRMRGRRPAYRRRPGWLRRHAAAVDVLLALLLLIALVPISVTALSEGPLRWPDGAGIPFIGLICLSVAFRRHAPVLLTSAGVVLGAVLAVFGYGNPLSELALLILFYSVATLRGLAVSLATLGWLIAVTLIALLFTPAPARWTDLALAGVIVAAVWLLGRSVRLRQAYLAELESRTDRLERAREADSRAARAEERSRIARDLHDVVAHHVSVMTVQASAARRVLDADPARARDAITAIEETGREALAEIRGIVGVLRTADGKAAELAPQPGLADVMGLVDQVREAGLPAELDVQGLIRPVPPGIDLAAYRLVQEALTNTLRHAGRAGHAWVRVDYAPRELTVSVEDDGQGPVPEARRGTRPDRGPGHGLAGIRERVTLYGGSLQVGRRQGGGFEVRASFPLSPA